MKAEERSLLLDHEWMGTFYPIGRKDLAFAGHLRYSATDGLKLQYAMPMNLSERDNVWEVLHGETSNGIPLTLVGKFSAQHSGFAFRHGQSYWTSSGHPFTYVIVGYHFEDGETFDSFDFEITGLSDFFVQKGRCDFIRYSKTPIASAKCKSGTFDVAHRAQFVPLGSDLRAQIHADNDVALEELQAAYDHLRQKHPSFFPYLRRELGYFFRLKPHEPCGVKDALRQIESVTALLSLLRFSPTRLTSISAIARDDSGHPHPMQVFPYRIDDQDAIDLSRSDQDYLSLPLNSSDLLFNEVLEAWSTTHDRYWLITSAVQNTTRKMATHEAHAAIVLAATQIESIAIADGERKKESKYSYPVTRYASIELRSVLAKLFSCDAESIGRCISDLRNELTHIGKPRTHLARMTTRDLYRVGRCLQFVIAGWILESLGVSPTAREKYQRSLVSSW